MRLFPTFILSSSTRLIKPRGFVLVEDKPSDFSEEMSRALAALRRSLSDSIVTGRSYTV